MGIMYCIAERAVQIKFYAKAILFGDWYNSEIVLVVPSVKPCLLPLLLVLKISNQKGSLLSSRLTPAYKKSAVYSVTLVSVL